MASIIIGASILVGHGVKHVKDKRQEKKQRLAEEQNLEIHGRPTVVSDKQSEKQKKQQQQTVSDLPSYESAVSGRQEFSREEKPRRNSEDSERDTMAPPRYE